MPLDEKESLADMADRYGTTPKAIFELLVQKADSEESAVAPAADGEAESLFPEGSGLGRMDLAAVVKKMGMDGAVAVEKLKKAGVENAALTGVKMREMAETIGVTPVELIEVLKK